MPFKKFYVLSKNNKSKYRNYFIYKDSLLSASSKHHLKPIKLIMNESGKL
jgi:hypothetical protein